MYSFLEQQKAYRDCLREVHRDSPNLEEAKGKLKKLFQNIVDANEEHKENPSGKKYAGEDKTSLELSFRSSLEELMKKINNKKDSKNNFPPKSLVVLMDLALNVTKIGFMDSTAPFSLLESVFDYQTIDGCCKIFKYLENRIEDLRAPELWTKLAQLAFLRICNGLLRRLSKTNNTIFCGKILMLMAYVFPLDDPSGQNKNSKFNLSNVTPLHESIDDEDIDMEEEEKKEKDKDNKEKKGKEKKVKKEKVDINWGFYRTLWGLQKLFNDPTMLTEDEHWKTFEKSISVVLSEFQKKKLSQQDNLGQLPSANYFPKYLTSPRLLPLQMRDSSFRRYFLLQCCVLFQLLLPPQTKGKAQSGRKLHVIPLTKLQSLAVRKMAENVMQLLNQNPVEKGAKPFAQEVEKILAREAIWIRWKENQCPKIQVKNQGLSINTPIPIKFPGEKKLKEIKMNHMGGISRRVGERVPMGTEELARLWSLSEDNVEILTDKYRKFTPKYPDFLVQMLAEDEDKDMEEDMKLKNNKLYTWRSLRLTSSENFQLFLKSNNGTLNPVLEELRKQEEKKKELTLKEEKKLRVNGHAGVKDEKPKLSPGKKRKREIDSETKIEQKAKTIKQSQKVTKKKEDNTEKKDIKMEDADDSTVTVKKEIKDKVIKKKNIDKKTDIKIETKKKKVENKNNEVKVKSEETKVEKIKSEKNKSQKKQDEGTKDKVTSGKIEKAEDVNGKKNEAKDNNNGNAAKEKKKK